jgi:hypothetical protein
MEAKELKGLRIGNIIGFVLPDKLVVVDEIYFSQDEYTIQTYSDSKKQYANAPRGIEDFEGVPITEEHLLDFGFERFEMSDTEKSYSINLSRNRRLSVIILGESKLIQITSCSIKEPCIPVDFVSLFDEMYDGKLYVHKLQNIAYELTGKDLELSQPVASK